MKKLILMLVLSTVAWCSKGTYTAVKKTTLSSAAEVVTVQLPVDSTRTVKFDRATVYCSVECEVSIERDGTAATTTSLTVAKVNSGADAGAVAFSASNVGEGTVISTQVIPAGYTVPFPLDGITLEKGQNLTIRTSSITGTAIINVKWTE
jgi:hypothetical protein